MQAKRKIKSTEALTVIRSDRTRDAQRFMTSHRLALNRILLDAHRDSRAARRPRPERIQSTRLITDHLPIGAQLRPADVVRRVVDRAEAPLREAPGEEDEQEEEHDALDDIPSVNWMPGSGKERDPPLGHRL